MTDRHTPTVSPSAAQLEGDTAPIIGWLEEEFPGWTVTVDATATWEGDLKALWIARQDGHHPQAELTAAKLHTRLTEYMERRARRSALSN